VCVGVYVFVCVWVCVCVCVHVKLRFKKKDDIQHIFIVSLDCQIILQGRAVWDESDN
jgi:hypothetical protein